MNIVVNNSKCQGEVKIPTSKSDLHRAIFAASLAKGTSIIQNVTLSNDVNATINAFRNLGATITHKDDTLIIEGLKDFENRISNRINCDECGSTLRFIIPILGMFKKEFIIEGSPSLLSRPLDIYEEIYKKQQLKLKKEKHRILLQGQISSGDYVLKGDISSQFVSGLLFYLPLLKEDSSIEIIPPFESESYVNMTIKTLKEFGIEIIKESPLKFIIKGNQEYKPRVYVAEADYSQFAFFAVLGAINGDITCRGLNKSSIQGDKVILDILKSFNVNYEFIDDKITVYKSNDLKGSVIDLSDCPDLGPVCMILSLFSKTPVKIINIKRLRLKESNRVESMVENLRKLNAIIEVHEDYMIVYPSTLKATKEILNSYNDHRIMMSLVVAASKVSGATKITNAACVKKSYINFYKDMQEVGVTLGVYM